MENIPVEEVIINGPFQIKTGTFKAELRDQNGNIIPSFTPEEIRLIRIAVRKLITSEQYHSHDDHEHERSAVGRIETLKTVLEKLK